MVNVGGIEFDKNVTSIGSDDVSWKEIPTQIGLLSELTKLSLRYMDVTGTIPSEIGLLKKLINLDLRNTALLGELPSELGLLTELTELLLSSNRFSGSLPSEIGHLVKLEVLNVAGAGLNGTLFSEMGNLERMQELRMGFNNFHGTIPTELGRMQKLSYSFQLSSNSLSGPIPSELGSLVKLETLSIQYNNLSGAIPATLWQATSLSEVELEGNALTGTLDGINQAVYLAKLTLHDGNELTGTLDPLRDMEELSELNVKDNRFTGGLAALTTLQELRRFEAARNELSGEIPKELSQLTELERLWVESNALTGTIPAALGDSSKLRHLLLGDNQLMGTIPKELFGASRLRAFDASDNQLNGTIPEQMFLLDRLSEIRLHRNAFTEFPRALTNISTDRPTLVMLDMTATCDCRLSWLPTFVASSALINPRSLGTCSNVNEYEGRPLYLLQTESHSPCAHAAISSLHPLSSTIEIKWTWADLAHQLPGFQPRVPLKLLADSNAMKSLRACEVFVFNGAGEELLGFHVQVDEILARQDSSKIMRKLCMLPSEISDSTVYSQVIDGLSPATQYEFRVRAFRLTLNAPLVGALRERIEVSYFYGPFGRSVGINTHDARPVAAVVVQPKRREADKIEVEWKPLAENETGGQVDGYIVYEHDPGDLNRSTSLEPHRLSHTFVGLASKPQWFVNFSIAARTSAGEGPLSEAQLVMTCPANSRDEASGSCEAVPGFFKDAAGEFINCADLTKYYPALWNGCVQANVTAATLPVAPRYWKANDETSFVLPCPIGEYCEPPAVAALGSLGADPFCAVNRTGVFCHECEGELVIAGRECVPCDETTKNDASVAIALTIAFFILLGFGLAGRILLEGKVVVCCKKRTRQGDPGDGSSRRSLRNRLRPLAPSSSLMTVVSSMPKAWSTMRDETGMYNKLKIFIGFQQVFFSYQRTFQFQEARSTQFLSFLTSLNPKHLMREVQYRCLVNYDFYGILLASTLTPLLFFSFLAILTFPIAKCLQPGRTPNPIGEPFAEIVLALLFLFYPDVSETVFETFPCESFNLSQGQVYKLQVDYKTDCEDGPERVGWLVYAGFMVVVYPLGVAALYAWIAVHRHRKGYAKFLIRPYDESCRWYETYELVRKLMQTSLIVLVRSATRDPSILGLISLNICLIALLVLVFTRPYKFVSDFWFATLSLVMLLPATQLSIIDPYARDQPTNQQITQLDAIVLTEFILFLLFLAAEVTGFDGVCAAKAPYVVSRYYGKADRKSGSVNSSPGSTTTGSPGNGVGKALGDKDTDNNGEIEADGKVEKASKNEQPRTNLVQVGTDGNSSSPSSGEGVTPVKRASVGAETEVNVTGLDLQFEEEVSPVGLEKEEERLNQRDIETV